MVTIGEREREVGAWKLAMETNSLQGLQLELLRRPITAMVPQDRAYLPGTDIYVSWFYIVRDGAKYLISLLHPKPT
jgi:hypothetical protein